jgi:hypothetical protein
MLNTTKEKLIFWLFVFVAVTTIGSLVASMTHMLEAFGWANVKWMGWVLAVVTVMQNAAFVALATINRDKVVRRAIFAGMVLLFLVEFAGNFWAGGLLVNEALPQEVGRLFFNFDRDLVIGTTTFLFAAFLPIINFISVYALSEAALRMVERAGQPQATNPWAAMVMQMQERTNASNSADTED